MRKLFSWLDGNILSIVSAFLLIFIPLYPKLPLADLLPGYIVRMRLEDIFVSGAILLWIVYLLRGKVNLSAFPLLKPISAYLIAGMLSVVSAIFLLGTVPMEKIHVAKILLHFARRVEYFSLFFIFFSSVKSLKTVKVFLSLFIVTVLAVSLYGFGQKYLYWPAFSTMNREYSKGWMLYLTEHARVLSTFGGHYDLAAYTMMALITLWSVFFSVRRIALKILTFLVLAAAFWLLILTASRTSFIAYLAGVSFMFFLWAYRKGMLWSFSRWMSVMLLSIVVMLSFGDLSERFTKLLKIDERLKSVKSLVMMPIGKPPTDKAYFLENNPDAIAQITSKSDQPPTPKRPSDVYQDIPLMIDASGSGTLSAVPRTYSNTAFRYDLSTAIRLDALWPMAISGFKRNVLLGSGYSTLNKTQQTQFTEAESTDNDYLRSLGETGLLGFVTFFGTVLFIIFMIWRNITVLKDPLIFSFSVAFAGLTFGLLVNAVYIDVFESSKVAFSFWGLSGVVLAGVTMSKKAHKTPVLPPKIADLEVFQKRVGTALKYMLRSDYFWLSIVLIAAFLLRLYKINTPLADWHSWRQADTSSVTAQYVKNGINVLYPTYHDISNIASGKDNPKGLRFVEFPLYNVASLITDKIIIGYNLEVSGRLTSVFSTLGTIIFLFLLVRKYADRKTAFTASILYAAIPYNIFFTRVILPDPFMVFLSTGMIYFADKYTDAIIAPDSGKGTIRTKLTVLILFLLFIVFASSALLVKPYAAFLLLPVVYIWIKKLGTGVKQLSGLVLILFIISLPLLGWRMWVQKFPEGVPAYEWLLNGDGIRFKGAFFQWIFADRLGRMILGYFGLPLLFAGILWGRWKNTSLFHIWGISILLYICTFATGNVRHDYYQTFTVPIIAVFLAQGVWSVFRLSRSAGKTIPGILMISVSLIFMEMFGWYHIRDLYNINHPEIVEAGNEVERRTPKDALIIAPYNGDTAFLYQTKRFGWPIMEDTVDNMIKMGAHYYVSVNYDDLTKQILREALDPDPLKRRFKVITSNEKYAIIQLVPDSKLPK